jgi:hypothetical protein
MSLAFPGSSAPSLLGARDLPSSSVLQPPQEEEAGVDASPQVAGDTGAVLHRLKTVLRCNILLPCWVWQG